jgi:hypothetical protein
MADRHTHGPYAISAPPGGVAVAQSAVEADDIDELRVR